MPVVDPKLSEVSLLQDMGVSEIRVTLFGGPYNTDPTIQSTILGSPIFGNPHMSYGASPTTEDQLPPIPANLQDTLCGGLQLGFEIVGFRVEG